MPPRCCAPEIFGPELEPPFPGLAPLPFFFARASRNFSFWECDSGVLMSTRVLEWPALAVGQVFEEIANFALPVAAMAAKGANRGEFAGLRPAGDRLGINPEE